MGKKNAAEVHHLELSAAGSSYNVVRCWVIHNRICTCIGLSAAAVAVTVVTASHSTEAVIVAALHLVFLYMVLMLHDLYDIAVVAVAIIIQRDDRDIAEVEGEAGGTCLSAQHTHGHDGYCCYLYV